jgi:hypothetical protein
MWDEEEDAEGESSTPLRPGATIFVHQVGVKKLSFIGSRLF